MGRVGSHPQGRRVRYPTFDVTLEQPYATWHEATGPEASAVHAVAVSDGRPSSVTVCGETVSGRTGELFVRTERESRCPYCAAVLGAQPV